MPNRGAGAIRTKALLQHSFTPVLHHSARQDSRTGCPTNRSSMLPTAQSASQARHAPLEERWQSRKAEYENEAPGAELPDYFKLNEIL